MNRFKHSRIEGLAWVAGDHSLVAGLAIMLALMLNSAAVAATPSASSVVDVESGRTNVNLAILSVLQPVPPGAQPGGGMFLQATVNARTWIGRNTKVVFYFAQHNVPSVGDVAIASASLGSSPGSYTAVAAAAHVPPEMPPGFYFVLACAGAGNCAATQGKVHVIGQGLSVVDQSPGLLSATPTATEYFPERPADGMSVGNPFPCPFSFHGQWPGSCEFVTTASFDVTIGSIFTGLMYCPTDHPYPYEVAIGFDPYGTISLLSRAAERKQME